MKKIAAFDFDGTLTTHDTFLAIIRYAFGTKAALLGFLRYAPLLILMKLHLYSNHKAKEKVFAHFFKGMEEREFDSLCDRFSMEMIYLGRSSALEALALKQDCGIETVIVSASIYNWVEPFVYANAYLCTEVEVKDGRLTGRFLTKNCYGKEKVNRLLERYPDRSSYHLTVFGDSRGDKELMAFADEAFYRIFH